MTGRRQKGRKHPIGNLNEEERKRERRRGRAQGLRFAASLLREGELHRADLLDALACDEERWAAGPGRSNGEGREDD